ncbi:MAG TPA: EAL domain-containing protein [Noviherbaspirillum sp.]|uniref:sensor domain-containing protein n=1 Tax=Noviherbaspirillum sp. TaxID=1926288 RepID=UPI002D5961C1|nr:EAL domain-containing protein [Noviherbaspirillum sp.]HYD97429.1 EAL domain-containing protein [Noviherbaspirillum sp.]
MPADSNYPAPFDTATFLIPAEWHAFSDLLGGADTGLLCLRDGVIIHVNAHLAQQLGYDDDELVGRPADFLFPQENAGASGDWQARDPENARVRLLSKGGRILRFHLISNRIDTLSDASCTIWVLKPEQAAGHAGDASRLIAIAENLPDPVVVCGDGSALTFCSQAFENSTGESSGALSDFVHPEDRPKLLATLGSARSAESAAARAVAFRLRHRDGSWRNMAALACRLPADDESDSVLLSMRDTTQELQQRQAIEAARRRQLHYLNRLFRLARQPHGDRESALKATVKSACKALGVQRCTFWEAAGEDGQMRCAAAYDDIRQNFVSAAPEPALQPLLQQALQGGEMAVNDVDQDPRTVRYCEYFHAAAVKALMTVPVRYGTQAAGLLLFATVGQARAWRKEETDFACNVGELAAQIVRQGRGRQEAPPRDPAHQDSLTGLPNRHFLFDQAGDFLPKATAGATTVATFFINLDGFKRINASFGHALGDELLKAAALRLRNVVRKDDVLVRLGGDEFLLLARNLSDMRIADDIAQQIVDTMRGAFSLQGRDLKISASVGIAIYPFDGSDIDTLMKKADIAMYQAKSAGRNQYHVFAPKTEAVARRSTLEAELRHAIEERELLHYYQPQIDLRTGKVICVEALLRWRHPRRGLLLPAAFLPVAEETGLIRRISHWVMNDACTQMQAWIGQGMDDFTLAINLSAGQLMDRSLLPVLENALDRTGIPPECLEWEVQESTVMQHNAMTSTLLDRLADLRIGLSIDDFGTGYSSMTYLRRYPVRKVKIDSSFVDGLPGEKEDRAITEAIISMAQPLGLEVVAEGVETPQQMEYLRERGCDIAQGYFFTQPLTAEQFETWLIRH